MSLIQLLLTVYVTKYDKESFYKSIKTKFCYNHREALFDIHPLKNVNNVIKNNYQIESEKILDM